MLTQSMTVGLGPSLIHCKLYQNLAYSHIVIPKINIARKVIWNSRNTNVYTLLILRKYLEMWVLLLQQYRELNIRYWSLHRENYCHNNQSQNLVSRHHFILVLSMRNKTGIMWELSWRADNCFISRVSIVRRRHYQVRLRHFRIRILTNSRT